MLGSPEAYPVPVNIPQLLLEDLMPHSREAVPLVLDGGVSLIHPQLLCFRAEGVRGILHSAGKSGPSRVSVPSG